MELARRKCWLAAGALLRHQQHGGGEVRTPLAPVRLPSFVSLWAMAVLALQSPAAALGKAEARLSLHGVPLTLFGLGLTAHGHALDLFGLSVDKHCFCSRMLVPASGINSSHALCGVPVRSALLSFAHSCDNARLVLGLQFWPDFHALLGCLECFFTPTGA